MRHLGRGVAASGAEVADGASGELGRGAGGCPGRRPKVSGRPPATWSTCPSERALRHIAHLPTVVLAIAISRDSSSRRASDEHRREPAVVLRPFDTVERGDRDELVLEVLLSLALEQALQVVTDRRVGANDDRHPLLVSGVRARSR